MELIDNSRLPIADLRHRVDGIDDEIDDDLRKLHAVAEDGRRGRLKIKPECYIIVKHLALDERNDVSNDIVQGEYRVGRIALPRQGTKTGR